MNSSQIDHIEKKLDRIARGALYLQGGLFLILLAILSCDFPHWKDALKAFSMLALIGSFIISRIYTNEGKRLEEVKTILPEEAEERKREYAFKFFSPYFLWLGCLAFSSF